MNDCPVVRTLPFASRSASATASSRELKRNSLRSGSLAINLWWLKLMNRLRDMPLSGRHLTQLQIGFQPHSHSVRVRTAFTEGVEPGINTLTKKENLLSPQYEKLGALGQRPIQQLPLACANGQGSISQLAFTSRRRSARTLTTSHSRNGLLALKSS